MGRDKALLPLPTGGCSGSGNGRAAGIGTGGVVRVRAAQEGFPAAVARAWRTKARARAAGRDRGGVGRDASRRRLVVLAVDLPLMTAGFLRGLLARAGDGRGVVPRHRGSGLYEPLAAVYPAECLALARERLRGEDWSLQGFVRAAGRDVRSIRNRHRRRRRCSRIGTMDVAGARAAVRLDVRDRLGGMAPYRRGRPPPSIY